MKKFFYSILIVLLINFFPSVCYSDGLFKSLRDLSNTTSSMKKKYRDKHYNKCKSGSFPRYEGQSKKGKAHGEGLHCIKKDEYYSGQFKNGIYEGIGYYFFSNGNKYFGEFKNGVYDGEGSFYFKNGNVKTGIFKNGKFIKEKVSD